MHGVNGVGNFVTKVVAMATSLKRSGKEGQICNLHPKSTIGDNLLKIGPLDPEISG